LTSSHLNNSLPQLRRGEAKKSEIVSSEISIAGNGKSEDKSEPEAKMILEETEGYISEDFDQLSSEDSSSLVLKTDAGKRVVAELGNVGGSLGSSARERAESSSRSFRTHTKDSSGKNSSSSFWTYAKKSPSLDKSTGVGMHIKDSPSRGKDGSIGTYTKESPSLDRRAIASSESLKPKAMLPLDRVGNNGAAKNETQVSSPAIDRVKKPPVSSTPVSKGSQVVLVSERSEQQGQGAVESEDTLSMCSESDGSRKEGEGLMDVVKFEEEEEEIVEEELIDEDTMFEDPVQNYEEGTQGWGVVYLKVCVY